MRYRPVGRLSVVSLLTAVLAVAVAAVWSTEPAAPGAASPDRPATAPVAPSKAPSTAPTTLPAGEPLLQVWSDGIYLLHSEPSPWFILWEDGTMFRRLNGRLYRAQLPPAEVARLVRAVREAGLFNPPTYVMIVRPDAGSQTIGARDGVRRVRLTYDGIYDGAGAGTTRPPLEPDAAGGRRAAPPVARDAQRDRRRCPRPPRPRPRRAEGRVPDDSATVRAACGFARRAGCYSALWQLPCTVKGHPEERQRRGIPGRGSALPSRDPSGRIAPLGMTLRG